MHHQMEMIKSILVGFDLLTKFILKIETGFID